MEQESSNLYTQTMGNQPLTVLLLIENSQKMLSVWQELKEHYLNPLVETIVQSSGSVQVRCQNQFCHKVPLNSCIDFLFCDWKFCGHQHRVIFSSSISQLAVCFDEREFWLWPRWSYISGQSRTLYPGAALVGYLFSIFSFQFILASGRKLLQCRSVLLSTPRDRCSLGANKRLLWNRRPGRGLSMERPRGQTHGGKIKSLPSRE